MAIEKDEKLKRLYFLSGLGADERIFSRLVFPGYEVVYLPWIVPKKGETLPSYAQRMAKQIPEHQSFLLAGISFGGMLATEIAKTRKPEKLFLFSTAKTKREIPLWYRIGGKMGLHRLIPKSLLRQSNSFTYYLFDVSDPEDKLLLKTIMQESDTHFIRWAMSAIVHWKNEELPINFLHIHGTTDRILPFRKIKNAIAVENAGHFMTHTHAAELNELIKKEN